MEQNNIRSIYVEMTPDLAQRYLDTMRENRKYDSRWVAKLTEVIKNGEWILDGNCIKMDENGHLIDGQHRLRAVVASGETVTMEVKSGFKHDAINVIDAFTKPRSLADVATLNGIADAAATSCIISAYFRERNGYSDTGRGTKLSPTSMLREYNSRSGEWYRIVRESANVRRGKRTSLPLLTGSQIGGIAAYLIFDKGHPFDVVFTFFGQSLSSSASPNVNIDKLRTFLIKNSMSPKKYPWSIVHQAIAKTWNAYISGREIRCLKYQPNEERIEFI